jgi:hypothetical protein
MLKRPCFTCFYVFSAFLLCHFSTQAQNNDDSLARELVKKHTFNNSYKQTIPGYRIQLFFGAQRDQAYEMRTEFIKQFPGISSYVLYQQPNFKLRVGDCKTRLEAQRLLHEIQPFFNGIFIVSDDVKIGL